MATRIDGKALAAKVKAQTAEAAKSLYRRPGLAVILVGNDPASRVYVTGKEKDCAECGFLSFEHALPEDTIWVRIARESDTGRRITIEGVDLP